MILDVFDCAVMKWFHGSHRSPNLAFQISQLHLYDCLRANKAMMAWGVEARIGFSGDPSVQLLLLGPCAVPGQRIHGGGDIQKDRIVRCSRHIRHAFSAIHGSCTLMASKCFVKGGHGLQSFAEDVQRPGLDIWLWLCLQIMPADVRQESLGARSGSLERPEKCSALTAV